MLYGSAGVSGRITGKLLSCRLKGMCIYNIVYAVCQAGAGVLPETLCAWICGRSFCRKSTNLWDVRAEQAERKYRAKIGAGESPGVLIYGMGGRSMLEILKAVLFGIVQGITEWLPISSTGHMILLDEFVSLDVSPEFMEAFLVVIQFGSILAVVLLFWKKIFPFDFHKKPFIKKDIFTLWFKIAAACIPAVLIGMPFDDFFEAHFYNYVCVAVALIVFGILFLLVENRNKRAVPKVTELSQVTYQMAFIIGIWQLIAAVFPGTSRSGATIIGALLLGVSRTVAAEFTFFLAIPVMFGASLLKLMKSGLAFSGAEWMILAVGMAVAFVVSVVVIQFLMGYIKKNDFRIFGWYRIALGILVLAYFMLFA